MLCPTQLQQWYKNEGDAQPIGVMPVLAIKVDACSKQPGTHAQETAIAHKSPSFTIVPHTTHTHTQTVCEAREQQQLGQLWPV